MDTSTSFSSKSNTTLTTDLGTNTSFTTFNSADLPINIDQRLITNSSLPTLPESAIIPEVPKLPQIPLKIGAESFQLERKPDIYAYNTYNKDAAIFSLDTKSFRDAQLPEIINPRDRNQISEYIALSFDINPTTGDATARRSLLGSKQLEDFKRDLLKSQQDGITWKFVMAPESIQNISVVGASERFEGYNSDRSEILKFINDNKIQNVIFVSDNIQGTVVNNLTYQQSPGTPQIGTGAFEITTGSVENNKLFGPIVVDIATKADLINPLQRALYNFLPIAYDSDNLLNDKDDVIKQALNAQFKFLGYDPIGLNNNLPVADDLIDAKLLKGDYISAHTYGQTTFDINEETKKLTVTTYGAPYSNSTESGGLIVSQFEVTPK
jgi:PhoD-like phosphatase